MDDNQNSRNEGTASEATPPRRDESNSIGLSALAEISQRLETLEKGMSDVYDVLNRARETGEVPYPGFIEHVAYVMQKMFPHDKPDGFDEKYRQV